MKPTLALARLQSGRRPFLLESGSDADGCGRFSFAGCDPVATLEWRLGDPGDPFDLLAGTPNPYIAVGYLGYGLAKVVEPRVPAQPDPHGLPELAFAFYDACWRLDHLTGRAEILGPGADALRARLDAPARRPAPLHAGPLRLTTRREDYERRLSRLLEYIHAGDVYQMNLTHALEADLFSDPFALFCAVRRFEAPFGAFVDLGDDRALVANSPERFLARMERHVESRPIKGTRPLGGAAELGADEKECAEHVMIVDLVRNDLGRVCRTGSVRVDGLRRVVRYPTLHHMISTVRGVLREGVGTADLLRATFPGGSITGAPKVRAMELIAELEPRARGVYTGAIGRIGPGDTLDLAMAIRTAVCVRTRISLGIGGGIVADSRPDAEWRESLLKARAFERALSGYDSPMHDRDPIRNDGDVHLNRRA